MAGREGRDVNTAQQQYLNKQAQTLLVPNGGKKEGGNRLTLEAAIQHSMIRHVRLFTPETGAKMAQRPITKQAQTLLVPKGAKKEEVFRLAHEAAKRNNRIRRDKLFTPETGAKIMVGGAIGFGLGHLINETGVKTFVHELGHAATFASLYKTDGLHITTDPSSAVPHNQVVQVQADGANNAKAFLHIPSSRDFFHKVGDFFTGANHVDKDSSGYTGLGKQHPNEFGHSFSPDERQAMVSAAGVLAVDLVAMAGFAYAAANVREHPFKAAVAGVTPVSSYLSGADYAWTAVGNTNHAAHGHDFIELSHRLSHITGAGAEPIALSVALGATILPPLIGLSAGAIFGAVRGDERKRQAKRVARWMEAVGVYEAGQSISGKERDKETTRRLFELFQEALRAYEQKYPREAASLTQSMVHLAQVAAAKLPECDKERQAFGKQVDRLNAYLMRHMPKEATKLVRRRQADALKQAEKQLPFRDRLIGKVNLAFIPVMLGVGLMAAVARHTDALAPAATGLTIAAFPLGALAAGLQAYNAWKEHRLPEYLAPKPVKRLSKAGVAIGMISLGLAAGVVFGGPAAPFCVAGLIASGLAGVGVFLAKERLKSKHKAMHEALAPMYGREMRRAFRDEESEKPEKQTVSWAKKILQAKRVHERHHKRLSPEATQMMHESLSTAEAIILKSGEVKGGGGTFRQMRKEADTRKNSLVRASSFWRHGA